MRAVTIKDGELAVAEHPDPVPGSGEVLVKVRAAGINGADIHQRAGRYPAPPDSPQDIPGLELAGEVVENGPGAFRFSPGDRVMSIVGGGGQSELAAVPERLLLTVPNNLDITHAGGAPEVFTTAHDALFTQANLQLGEKLLIHGGAGGVGTAAVQLGRAAGARVYATVRNPELRGGVEQLGATVLAPDEFTDHGPFDVILELVGGPNLSDNVNSLNMLGRISVIGIGAGANGELNLGALLSKRGRIMASMIRYRPLEDKAATARGMERSVLPLFETGELTVPVAATFPLEQAADAYDRFTAGGKLGKIILTID
ncbi:MAG TPA: NAD(P)H-quinone oxidoreductase [Solirubrobacteraceae bacterium]|nr:NAD(P)H-quinone oxidoreductase [Solirubrobacteraceae bacterium]